jgi:hypothetical protein
MRYEKHRFDGRSSGSRRHRVRFGASVCDCCDAARTRSRESDLKMTLELEVNDMQYSNRMLTHNPQVRRRHENDLEVQGVVSETIAYSRSYQVIDCA